MNNPRKPIPTALPQSKKLSAESADYRIRSRGSRQEHEDLLLLLIAPAPDHNLRNLWIAFPNPGKSNSRIKECQKVTRHFCLTARVVSPSLRSIVLINEMR